MSDKIADSLTKAQAQLTELDKDTQGRSHDQLKNIKRNADTFSKGKGYNGRQLNFYIDTKTKLR